MGSLSRDRLIHELAQLSESLHEIEGRLEIARAIHQHKVAAEATRTDDDRGTRMGRHRSASEAQRHRRAGSA